MNRDKAKCISNKNYKGNFTINKQYLVKEVGEGYIVVVDNLKNILKVSNWKDIFKIIKEDDDVLQLEYQNVFEDNVVYRITHRDEDVFPTGFEDKELSVYCDSRQLTHFYKKHQGHVLVIFDNFLEGIEEEENLISMTTTEHCSALKELVARINNKYNHRKKRTTIADILNSYISNTFGKHRNWVIRIDDNGVYVAECIKNENKNVFKYYSEEDARNLVNDLNEHLNI